MHGGRVHGLHGERGIGVEGIEVLDGRLVLLVMVVVCRLSPGGVVFKGILVVVLLVVMVLLLLLVIHVQLAHGSGGGTGSGWRGGYVCASAGVRVVNCSGGMFAGRASAQGP